MIPIEGKPMFIRALESLSSVPARKTHYFCLLEEHIRKNRLDELVGASLPGSRFAMIPQVTRGAAETCLFIKEQVDPDSALIIMDCDIWFDAPQYSQLLIESLADSDRVDAALLYFNSSDPRYSYVRVKNGRAMETAEKVVISSNALTGAYYFAQARYFISHAEKYVATPLTELPVSEYYIAPLFNRLILEGANVQARPARKLLSFGTPEELRFSMEKWNDRQR
jgi:NDP-sugar pyrophosphorylase family protein